MNGCMKIHSTPDAEDAAREEWFATIWVRRDIYLYLIFLIGNFMLCLPTLRSCEISGTRAHVHRNFVHATDSCQTINTLYMLDAVTIFFPLHDFDKRGMSEDRTGRMT